MFPLSFRKQRRVQVVGMIQKQWQKKDKPDYSNRGLHPKPASKETPANIWWKCDFQQISSAEANSSPPPKPHPIALVERAVTYTYQSGQASAMIPILIHLANEESAIQLTCSDPPEKLKSTYLGSCLAEHCPSQSTAAAFPIIVSRAPSAAPARLSSTNTKEKHLKQNCTEKTELGKNALATSIQI